ncbi:hypothetical protein COY93_00140 [Candidatus Uhrbacteria bacterium CG_4_10_14_0_8_um_filter_58_22]|uniref:Uncharacterized protein n=1 Tax=Candidatus Uhrbacteria bacterium CG_4_10_14_0_8_um_filter_58_22 TaxID=1975029 RepID=A0A2M7QB51_9BACT|nr:MAG: hypothetical protein AUJ19_02705 [Parcubacteria group bacterium CG1_02_58_44]PIY63398.1 MAG: hypothetical protein COY93_00140 [Candidatus Uhrbacteria bacterium CG_4_10_14_0_8_um_filter_58_22]
MSGRQNEVIADCLQPDDIESWGSEPKQKYLSCLGRLLSGRSMLHSSFVASWRTRLLGECRRLAGSQDNQAQFAVRSLLDIGGIIVAMEMNTNTAGSSGDLYGRLVSEAAERFDTGGDAEAVEALTNPYRLEPGTEVIRFDWDERCLKVDVIQDVASGAGGLLIVGDEPLDLNEYNRRLASGRLMLKSGDNIFGGIDLLRQNVHAELFQSGSTITYVEPFRTEAVSVTVVGSNQAELEGSIRSGVLAVYKRGADGRH